MPAPENEKSFYKYKDGEGQDHIVDSLEAIPEKYRPVAEKIDDVKSKAQTTAKKVAKVQREAGDVVPFVKDLHAPSVLVGFAGALLVYVVLGFVRHTGKTLVKVALLVAVVLLLSGAYLGWLRSAAGLGEARFSTPKEIIDDAHQAADRMKKSMKDTERALEQIDQQSK